MLDHVGLSVRDYAASRAFYEPVLKTLGYELVTGGDDWKGAGFGDDGKPTFWVVEREPVGTGTHVAFHCADRASVDAFHRASLAAGGTDNGAPGVREHYHPTYYGAFVLDGRQQRRGGVPHRVAA